MPPCLENLKNLGGLYIFICIYYLFIQFSLEDILIDFRDRERGSWRGKEGGETLAASPMPPTWDRTCNLGMYADWESNPQPFDL